MGKILPIASADKTRSKTNSTGTWTPEAQAKFNIKCTEIRAQAVPAFELPDHTDTDIDEFELDAHESHRWSPVSSYIEPFL